MFLICRFGMFFAQIIKEFLNFVFAFLTIDQNKIGNSSMSFRISLFFVVVLTKQLKNSLLVLRMCFTIERKHSRNSLIMFQILLFSCFVCKNKYGTPQVVIAFPFTINLNNLRNSLICCPNCLALWCVFCKPN